MQFADHVVWINGLMEQDRVLDDVAERPFVRRVENDPAVRIPRRVEPEKIVIGGDQDPGLCVAEVEVRLIIRVTKASLVGRRHVDATTDEFIGDRGATCWSR